MTSEQLFKKTNETAPSLHVQYDANTEPGMEHRLLNSCSAHSVYVLRSTFSLFHYILNNYFPFFCQTHLKVFHLFSPSLMNALV